MKNILLIRSSFKLNRQNIAKTELGNLTERKNRTVLLDTTVKVLKDAYAPKVSELSNEVGALNSGVARLKDIAKKNENPCQSTTNQIRFPH